MTNFAVASKKVVINTSNALKHTGNVAHKVTFGRMALPANSLYGSGVVFERNGTYNVVKERLKSFINYINEIKNGIFSKKLTKKGFNVERHPNDEVTRILQQSIGDKPYRIATSGYSFDTEGYEDITKSFLESIDKYLGSKNTGYIFPPTLDKGSIYDITSQISGLRKDKTLFFTVEKFYNEFLNPKKFSRNINMDEYAKIPVHIFPEPEIYTKATANASNVLVCTGGREIAVKEIIEAIKRKNKVVLLHNLNLQNGTYNNEVNVVENAARYFDEMRLSKMLKCSKSERREMEVLLKDKDKINELVRVYLVNDAKSAAEAGERAAKFIKSSDTAIASNLALPNIEEVKTMSLQQLRELAKMPEGIKLMQQAGVVEAKAKGTVINSVYGPIKYKQIMTTDKKVISSSLVVPQSNGKETNIFAKIPQKVLQSPVKAHIHPINWSTINPEVGVTVTQNQSSPVIARKIISEGTLENSLSMNNMHNIPLRYDVVKESQYLDTLFGRQAMTGDGFMVIYSQTVKKKNSATLGHLQKNSAKGKYRSVSTVSEDRSFVPSEIISGQYEIITKFGRRIPCNYQNMKAGVDYTISKKAGVKLKMAVPSREVISSEGEILSPNKLYMVDSMGHFYDGNPIKRIKSGEINWKADMTDPVQAEIRNLIDYALMLEAKAKAVRKISNSKLGEELFKQAEQVTLRAEQKMTDWVRKAQNPKGVEFFQSV